MGYIQQLESRVEELENKCKLLSDNINLRQEISRRRDAEYEALATSHKSVLEDYRAVCGLVADMHAAAVGEIRGPTVGPIEDIKELKRKYDELLKESH